MSSDWLKTGEAFEERRKTRPSISTTTNKLVIPPNETKTVVFSSDPVAVLTHGVRHGRSGEFRTKKCAGEKRCLLCLRSKAAARAKGFDNWREADETVLRLYILCWHEGKEWFMDFISSQHLPFFRDHQPVQGLKVEITKDGGFAQSRLRVKARGHEGCDCRDATPFILSHKFCLPPDVITEKEMEMALKDLASCGETSLAPITDGKPKTGRKKTAATNGHATNGRLVHA